MAMRQNALDNQFARKIEDGFVSQTTLKHLRLNFSEFELKGASRWIADTTTSKDGSVVFGAVINAIFSSVGTLSAQNYYHHPLLAEFKNAFTNEAQARKNQAAITLLQSWKTRSAGADDKSWDLVKSELEDGALSNRRRFEK
jgi:hypothetical protein